jgi:hypothetical protein
MLKDYVVKSRALRMDLEWIFGNYCAIIGIAKEVCIVNQKRNARRE